MRRILIANRGEVAVRVARTASDIGLQPVGVFAPEDEGAPYLAAMAAQVRLPGRGAAAYLDIDALIAAARAQHCALLHPGWGFASESPALAAACAAAGIGFIGPDAATLALFGSKLAARELAQACGVPVAQAAQDPIAAEALLAAGPVMLKAASGGGGRGMRVLRDSAALSRAWAEAAEEAERAFGDGTIFAETLMEQARHVEVQIAGDGRGAVSLGSRDCTLQRRRQKLIETAPACLDPAITEAALRMARHCAYRGLGTWEFLVNAKGFIFIEVNPRLQVEHTVTEAVTGLDLVAVQIGLTADGRRLEQLGLAVPPAPRGYAMQLRINAERISSTGEALPSGGTIAAITLPSGPGIRVDHAAACFHAPSPMFDSLLAKLIIHAPDRAQALARARRALQDCVFDGITTNLAVHRQLLDLPEFIEDRIDTGFFDARAADFAQSEAALSGAEAAAGHALAPMPGTVMAIMAAPGQAVALGAELILIEAMKMQTPVLAPCAGVVRAIRASVGEVVHQHALLVEITPAEGSAAQAVAQATDPAAIRRDLQAVIDRTQLTLDAGRPEAVARRHAAGRMMIREALAALLDAESFNEYGAMALAAQRRRRSVEELIRISPADGLVCGMGAIGGRAVAVLAYDYTVMAGTQGFMNHKKTDRLLKAVHRQRLPLVLFAEGGGGRPGDSDVMGVAGLDLSTFAAFAALSGNAPVVGIAAGYCFAGNAALLGCCDVIIATRRSSIGMGGPAMIEGGGLGVVAPEAVGPSDVQSRNGVIDVLVEDEAEAIAVARQYLAYFFTPQQADFTAGDARALRAAVPEDRKRIYNMRALIAALCDTGAVLELRRDFAPGMITALVRIAGRAFGLIANNPAHLGGAIDAAAADKAARFLQLCDAHALPVISLCDTPGFMVGPAIEREAQVRRVSRMFVLGAKLRVPVFCVVTRKGYGLGAIAMAGGGFHESHFTIAWPSGEFGGMGLEGAVRLGYRRELEAIADPAEREALFNRMVERMYAEGQAMNMAAYVEIDAVIDPAETRAWILRGLRDCVLPEPGGRFIDTW